MLQTVEFGVQPIESYRDFLGEEGLAELRELARSLKGARVLHLNATPYGGGVSELLRSSLPLLCDLGLQASWSVIYGDATFFAVTKTFHNALQGKEYELTAHDCETYLSYNARNAGLFEGNYDYIIVNDPQPAAMLHFHKKGSTKWIWRCHIDTSHPNQQVWEFLHPFIEEYDAAVFTMREFAPRGLALKPIAVIPPAIDPLSPKNQPLPKAVARRILGWLGLDMRRPLITQVSRFDPWKDPMGTISVYRLAKKAFPAVQLAMVGSMALDDPEGWDVYARIREYAEGDPDIFILTNFTGVGSTEVNAFQGLSQVVVQKSLREGFGLVVSETLWKKTPVVAGRTGGIPMQLQDGASGFTVNTVEECAEKVIWLLAHPEEAAKMGAAGRRWVRRHFLMPRLVRDELALLASL